METQNFASPHVVLVDCQLFAAIKFMFIFKLSNKGVAAGDEATRGSTGSAPPLRCLGAWRYSQLIKGHPNE